MWHRNIYLRALMLLLILTCGTGKVHANLIAKSDGPALIGFKLNHWSVEEGAPSRINTITQSRDGFLWIGGVDGLFRFDGVYFEKMAPLGRQEPRIVVSDLLATRDGAIWIGLARGGGVRVWKNGRLTDPKMPNASREVNHMAEGPDGSVWIARGGRSTRSLSRFYKGGWQEFDINSGLPREPVWNILFAADRTQWLALETGIYKRDPGSGPFKYTGIQVWPRASLSESTAGDIWVSDRTGTRRVSQQRASVSAGVSYPTKGGIRTLFDENGDFWGVTWRSGAFRVPALGLPFARERSAKVLAFDTQEGLLSDTLRAIYEDREGNIWIGGELGLNMIRRVPISIAPEIEANPVENYKLAVDKAGVVYVGDASGIYRILPKGSPQRLAAPAGFVEALCSSKSGGVWAVLRDRLVHINGPQLNAFSKPGEFVASSCSEDKEGRIWVPALDKGLRWYERGRWGTWEGFTEDVGIPGNALTMPDGRSAIHFRMAGPKLVDPPFYPLVDKALPTRSVEGLFSGKATFYVSGARGLVAPLLAGQPLLDSRIYPWAASLNGLAETSAGETWAIGDKGIVRLQTSDLAIAFRQPGKSIPYRIFDFRDGLPSFVQKSSGPQAVAGADGRIWFATRQYIVSLDPKKIPINTVAPNAIIRELRSGTDRFLADRELKLRPESRRVEIIYTATNLGLPERSAFKYRLSNLHAEWIDQGNKRKVVFEDLASGTYKFELLAANENGVWSKNPATLVFIIPQPFHQQWWFRILVVLLVFGLLYALYSFRLQQVSRQIRTRMIERTRERERIARELHDTMIQGIQGLILRFQVVADKFEHDENVQAILTPALDRAEEMLIEGRERVIGLRGFKNRSITEQLERIISGEQYPEGLIAPINVIGKTRKLSDGISVEIVAVMIEALNNAIQHSRASRIELGLSYGRKNFVAYVRDNGIGIDPELIAKGGKPGHFGLIGMQERITNIEGKLSLESARNFGTEVRISIPARAAYADRR